MCMFLTENKNHRILVEILRFYMVIPEIDAKKVA